MQFVAEGTVEDVYAPPPTDKYPEEKVFITFRTARQGDFRLTFAPDKFPAADARRYRNAGQVVKLQGVARGRIIGGRNILEIQDVKIVAVAS